MIVLKVISFFLPREVKALYCKCLASVPSPEEKNKRGKWSVQ